MSPTPAAATNADSGRSRPARSRAPLGSARPIDFVRRRRTSIAITLAALVLLALLLGYESSRLRNPAWTSGWTLGGMLLFLTLLSLRKRLNFLPLGSLSSWMQAHLHVGWASIVVAALHVGPKIPEGAFERILAGGFLLLAASGLYGAWLSRTAPRRLAALPFEIRYEEIPVRRRALDERVRQTVLESARTTGVLGEFHVARTADFFARPRSWRYWLWPSGDERRRLESELAQLDRYLTDEQRALRQRLSQAVRERDDLDYHQALQGRLKYWLFLHVAGTWGLWVLVALHVAVVHAFRGV